MGNKMRLLSTAAISQSAIEDAAAKGVAVDVVPFIEITHVCTESLVTTVRSIERDVVNVIFTSAQAVIAIKDCLGNTTPAWNIFCVGSETLKKVQQLLPSTKIIGAANNASDIAKVIIDNRVNDVYFFCSNIRLNNLPDALAEAKIRFKEVVVYITSKLHNKIDIVYDGILFYSPSGVNSFFADNTVTSETTLFSIGNTTAAAIRKHSANNIVVSDKPSKDQMVSEAVANIQQQITTNKTT